MKKIINLLFIIVFSITMVHAQQGWVDHKVDDKVSVKFPFTPKEIVAGTFVALAPDSSIAYIVTLVDFQKVAGLDEATLSPLETTPEFMSQMKTGIAGSLPNVDLADFTLGVFKSYNSYTTTGIDDKKKQYNMFMFIVGTNLYSFSTVTKPGLASTDDRNKFLGSIVITK